MLQLIFPYLLATGCTMVVVLVAVVAFVHHRRSAETYDGLAANLPDACRWADLQSRVSDKEREFQDLQVHLAQAQVTISRKQEAEDWLRINGPRYSEIQEQLPIVSARLEGMQSEWAQLTEQRNTLQKELSEGQYRRDLLKEETNQLTEQTEKRREELEALSRQLATKKEEHSRTVSSLAELDAKLLSRDKELNRVEEQLSGVAEAYREASQRLETTRAELQGIEGRVKYQTEDLRRLEAKLSQIKQEEAAREKSLANLTQRESTLQKELVDVESRHGRAEREFRDNKEKLDAVSKQLSSSKQELDQVRAEHGRLKNEVAEAKLHFEALQKRIGESLKVLPQGSQASEEDKLAELWSPVLEQRRGRRDQTDELRAIQQTQNYLRDLGLYFPDRTLRAFHTSLKSADISPLVVLAGISGTGKSELPRRYAEGMGMHFLNLAVQPRWDSPQDMFGFYNYLENKYRATELSRALVQMDPFGAVPGRGWQCPPGWSDRSSRSEDMLLVLLDEMNLARVEYYFSEFLSRLETRRGISKRDSADRRKAEIGLEVGMQAAASGNGTGNGHVLQQPTMQLFVDTNVLFVGTMNEDESTQTLSDKVVDRANVLRFGRPVKLDRATRNPNIERPDMHLSFKSWQQWVRGEASLSSEISLKVNTWIETLNNAMHQIRRPFAFRTSSAIRAYVANYPDVGRYEDAMADQIELKILPKFRGLDLTDSGNKRAMQKIKDLLKEELHDEQLFRAIEESERHGQGEHQFMWSGVDRSGEGGQ